MKRQLEGSCAHIAKALAIALGVFHLYTAAFPPLPDMQQRAIHVMLGFLLTFATISATKKTENKIPFYDFILMAMIAAAAINAAVKYVFFHTHIGWESPLDTTLAVMTLLVTLEAVRRITGLVFVVLTLLCFIYAMIGPMIPGTFGHRGFDFFYLVRDLYQTTDGFWGYIVGISANVVAMFLILGAFLLFTGGGETFINLALSLMGRFRGGPAMTAVIASALFGTISGSALANIAATGNYTIPMMKRLGYRPEFAGAVEACASSGGQIAPPVMGASAFIMAELLGMKYTDIAIAAVIPAFLYFSSLLFYVRCETLRLNLAPVPREEIPSVRSFLSWSKLAPFVLPIATLIYLIGIGWSPGKSCFWATLVAAVIFLCGDLKREKIKSRMNEVVNAVDKGGRAIVEVVSILVAANIVVRLLTITGVTVKLSQLIIGIGGEIVLLALLLTMVVAILLGMGLPTTASYLLAVSVVGPALIRLGFTEISTHMFVFYFAVISIITPPICPGCYAAAAIAGAPWLKIAWIAVRLAAVIYIVPYVWMFEPALLMASSPFDIIVQTLLTLLGALCLAMGLVGYFTTSLNALNRPLIGMAGLLFILPGIAWSLYGAIPLVAIFLINVIINRRKKQQRRAPKG